jgi:UDP-3-O-[3-hydroxymyristoyl] N-acetylglucosamine deacetylase
VKRAASSGAASAGFKRVPERQRTLRSAVGCRGVGLHSGAEVNLVLRPARPNAGVVVRRTDLVNGGGIIPLVWRNVVGSRMATTVGNEYGATVATVEHLMAALAGCGVDNVTVEIDAGEIPVMDGSAAPFVTLIERAGLIEQNAVRRAIRVLRPIAVGDETKSLSVHPAPEFGISFDIDFDEPTISRQRMSVTLENGAFKHEIARARTFGFEHEVAQLRRSGLALGGSLENAVVISRGAVLNEGGLRYDDEFVRHKILDCVGDLYLAGAPIVGRVRGFRSGHALNHALLQALFADEAAWCYTLLSAGPAEADWSDRRAAANS